MPLLPRLLLSLALFSAIAVSANDTVILSPIDIVPFGDPVETAVACAPSSCTVAWVTLGLVGSGGVERDLYLRTYAADGTPFQSVATRVSGPFSHSPSVVWNGSEYVVTWIEPQCARGGDCDGFGFVRVSEEGVLISGPRYVASIPTRAQSGSPVIAWNGSTYLVWVEGVLYRLSADFEVISSQPIEPVLAITSNGDRFLVVVNRAGRLLAQILSSEGAPLFETELAPGTRDVTGAAASFNGQSFGVVWTAGLTVSAAEVSAAGAITSRSLLSTVGGFEPSLVWRNFLWTATWQATGNLCTSGFSGDFARTRCDESSGEERDLVIASSSSSGIAAWVSAEDFPPRVNVQFLDPFEELTFAADRIASENIRQLRLPSIARNTGGSAVAWSGTGLLYVGGRNDDGTLRPLVLLPTEEDVISFQAVSAPDTTLVLWEEDTLTDAYAAVLDTNNRLLAAPVRVGNSLPAAAFDGQAWRLVWSDDLTLRLLTMRLGRDGTRSPVTTVAETGTFQTNPDVACDGATNCVATWDEDPGFFEKRIQAARIGTGQARTVGLGSVSSPSIAWNGSHYVIAWSVTGTGSALSYRAARVDRDARRFFPADERGFLLFDGSGSREIELVSWSNGRVIAFSPDDAEPRTTIAYIAADGDSVARLASPAVRALDVAADGDRVVITYEENGRILLGTLTGTPRRRAVRR